MAKVIKDLNECVELLVAETPEGTKCKHDAQMYGQTQSVPDRSIVDDVLGGYVDKYYVAAKKQS